jgi:Flp pilus assembly pilin Flp
MSRSSRHPSQRGQAAAEYAVVMAMCVIALITVTSDPSVIDELITAMKNFYRAFSYAISVTPQDQLPP